ncbi:BppU family phage baseplate upper protein [Lactiplantibacillus paraxiangfangensis]|uniref:BppU family phage baseplate upper protein n=1 Tax=Lactiplantibacillus paraxiangfangensis TaxID=3076224 RepID=UPI0030C6C831
MINLALDTSKQNQLNPVVLLRVGDGGVDTIHAVITDNGELMDLTGYTVEFRGMNAAGNLVVDSHVTVNKNEITWTMPNTAASVAGKYERAYFTFKKGGNVTSTANIRLEVFNDVDMSADEAKPYIAEYDRLVQQLQADFDAAKSKLTTDVSDFTTSAGTVVESTASYATSTADSSVAYAKKQTDDTLTGVKSQADSMGALAQSNADLSNSLAAGNQFASKSEVASAASQANKYTDIGLTTKADDAKVIHTDSGYGAENLVMNSGYPNGTEQWSVAGNTAGSGLQVATHGFYHNGTDNLFILNNVNSDQITATGSKKYVTAGETVSWSVKAFAGANVVNSDVYLIFDDDIEPVLTNVNFSPTSINTYSGTFVVPAGKSSVQFRIDNNGTIDGLVARVYYTEVKVAREDHPSPWTKPVVSGGWVRGTMDCASSFYGHNTSDRSGVIGWNKYGNIVTVWGIITPATTLPASPEPVKIADWLPNLGVPVTTFSSLQQGSGSTSEWQLTVTRNAINFQRYRNQTSFGAQDCPAGTWLPFTITVIVQA